MVHVHLIVCWVEKHTSKLLQKRRKKCQPSAENLYSSKSEVKPLVPDFFFTRFLFLLLYLLLVCSIRWMGVLILQMLMLSWTGYCLTGSSEACCFERGRARCSLKWQVVRLGCRQGENNTNRKNSKTARVRWCVVVLPGWRIIDTWPLGLVQLQTKLNTTVHLMDHRWSALSRIPGIVPCLHSTAIIALSLSSSCRSYLHFRVLLSPTFVVHMDSYLDYWRLVMMSSVRGLHCGFRKIQWKRQ